ncbi:hypothetical protein K435DRAFT_826626 [Dendrothele bispora CBS 962.96]|uniref:DUF1279 domain-containing protein n=1 Tax=Dendrothele bispora (strain CBS 962.96) TaxID=1314807 RepID=A0A4S8MQ42_DENBC|nr:hypothetical protein K435DRAFT_826626 [Dendrothele bispora CBS 962.96]
MARLSAAFAQYRKALNAISARTGTPLPSLILSFGILHELTAIVPLVGIFYGARTLGIGERVITAVIQQEPTSEDGSTVRWMKQQFRAWVEEGEGKVERVGRRYGLFGFEKGAEGAAPESFRTGRIAGDVANAVVAYGATKALLPVRIGASLYLSPGFSRAVIGPIQNTLVRLVRRP